jgi:hydroxymethylpyrimidine/phosphomethylpyrimidine kinase
LIPRILAISGSDSGGGAGLQGDLKTITMLGGYAMTAVTAVTVQNSQGVSAIHPVPPAIVAGQIAACLDDFGADAIKIGMLGAADTIAAVADALAAVTIPIVLDPVMVAKGGARLLADEAVETLLSRLLPRATLVTPNAPELEALTDGGIADEADLLLAAQELLGAGPAAVLAKGGHLEGDRVVDWLVSHQAQQRFEAPRIAGRHNHGTGCTLAAAVATHLGAGLPLAAAVERARAYLLSALTAAPGFGHGHGPIGHNFALLG